MNSFGGRGAVRVKHLDRLLLDFFGERDGVGDHRLDVYWTHWTALSFAVVSVCLQQRFEFVFFPFQLLEFLSEILSLTF